jgi:hypothetical protein
MPEAHALRRGMTRLLSIVTLIMALVALSAPSVSLGMGVRGPVWTSSDSSVSELASAKVGDCKLLGGKRVLPCHPDLGVMATTMSGGEPPLSLWLPRAVALPLTAATPKAELPPPRRG